MYQELAVYFLFILAMLRGLYLAGYTSCMLLAWRFFVVYAALQIQPSLAQLIGLLFELPRQICQNCAFIGAYILLEAYQRSQIIDLASTYRFQNLGIINNFIGVAAYTVQFMLIFGILMCYFERAFEMQYYPEFFWFYENPIIQQSMRLACFVFPRFDFEANAAF
ncbi:hypothetical protein [Flavobacterium sp.]|uniref:hypothetical protein n=1 Tax=Flavobacterium sp. TaxID=239 RepID=UPI00263334D8|nr:hypothetical protein [Flavobacterium sp.]